MNESCVERFRFSICTDKLLERHFGLCEADERSNTTDQLKFGHVFATRDWINRREYVKNRKYAGHCKPRACIGEKATRTDSVQDKHKLSNRSAVELALPDLLPNPNTSDAGSSGLNVFNG